MSEKRQGELRQVPGFLAMGLLVNPDARLPDIALLEFAILEDVFDQFSQITGVVNQIRSVFAWVKRRG